MEIHNIQDLQYKFDQDLQRVEELIRLAQESKAEAALPYLQKAWLRLKQGPVRVLVLGVSSAGKSTLINALAGHIIVPEGKHTTSPIPVWVCSNEQAEPDPDIQIIKHKDGSFEQSRCGRFIYLTDYCYTSSEAGRGLGQEKFEDLMAAMVNVDSASLADTGVTFIDTPGIGVSDGDNARVNEILKDSCEMMVIPFMTLQEDNVKAYFKSLLVEEDGQLRNLLDNNRVFMVLNATKPAHMYAKLDTRYHIRDAFDGWNCDEDGRLFVINLQDARLDSCGIYSYPDLLPKRYSEDDKVHAREAKKQEVERKPKAKHQDDLDRLCQALADAVEELCEDPDAVEALLSPIRDSVAQAVAIMAQPLDDECSAIARKRYSAPPEKQKRITELNKQHSAMMRCKDDSIKKLQTGCAQSNKWPAKDLARKMLKKDTVQAFMLLTDSKDAADLLVLQEMLKEDGPERLTALTASRVETVMYKLNFLLGNEEINDEMAYWQKTFNSLNATLEKRSWAGDFAGAERDEQIVLMRKTLDLFTDARNAGRKALAQWSKTAFTTEQKTAMQNYLEKKRKGIQGGGIRAGWNRRVLYSGFVADILQPMLKNMSQEGAQVFMDAYRDTFWNGMPELLGQYKTRLQAACSELEQAQKAAEEDLQRWIEAARQEELDRVEQQRKQLYALCID